MEKQRETNFHASFNNKIEVTFSEYDVFFSVSLWIEVFSKSNIRHNQPAIVSQSVYDDDAHEYYSSCIKEGQR